MNNYKQIYDLIVNFYSKNTTIIEDNNINEYGNLSLKTKIIKINSNIIDYRKKSFVLLHEIAHLEHLNKGYLKNYKIYNRFKSFFEIWADLIALKKLNNLGINYYWDYIKTDLGI